MIARFLAQLSSGLVCLGCVLSSAASQESPTTPDTLPGTQPLDWEGALDERLMRGAHAFVERKIAEAVESKPQRWSRDTSSPANYQASIEPNRQRLEFLLGAGNQKKEINTHVALPREVPKLRMQRIGDEAVPCVLFANDEFQISRVRWPALDGVWGEGLLLEPAGEIRADAIVIPDADQHPEQLAGLLAGLPANHQLARTLAASGVRVLVPVLINRQAVNDRLGQSNREWIYRQSFHMGRHIIGYEVDKVRAAIEWLQRSAPAVRPMGLAGWGEGARLALYVSALDPRVTSTLLSGDWLLCEAAWREPIYRNVWSLMSEFDDADLASMIAPRKLLIEIRQDPPIDATRDKALPDPSAAPVAQLTAAAKRVPWPDWLEVLASSEKSLPAYDRATQQAFANSLEIELRAAAPTTARNDLGEFVMERHTRQLRELDDYTQRLIRDSSSVRDDQFLNQILPELGERKWSTEAVHATTPVESFTSQLEPHRQRFAEQILGRFDEPLLPANPRSRLIETTEQWLAYDVVLDVAPEMFAWGILMLPRDLRPDEQRPVVVVQHGRNGLPANVMHGGYNGIAGKLLERGFIVFAPHNLYRGEDAYRWLDRKANAIGKSLFSCLLLQHDQITRWLADLPQVDGERIAFYGNSYGGESAVRIPTVLTRYALSICASDFNDWTRKVADTHARQSFMNTTEWEMPYFNMGSTFSYAEMAYLMVPRPFMVERGHHDLVAPDHWVASEYAKVRLVYDQLGIGERTAITFFQGGHTMRGEATVEFLEKHLLPVR